MPKMLRVFIGLTIALMATSFYLYYQLETTRAELEFVRTNGPQPGAHSASASPAAAPGPLGSPGASRNSAAASSAKTPDAAPAGTAMSSSASSVAASDPQREAILPFARQFLAQYDNSAQRAALAKQARSGLAAQYARLKDKLGLSDEKFEQLLNLLGDEALEQQAHYLRCVVDPSCDPMHMGPPPDHTSEYEALLGGDYDSFSHYRGNLSEWQSVAQMRGRLSDANVLRDADADRLVGSLSAESELIRTEVSQLGGTLRGWGNGQGTVWYVGDGAVEQQLASAQANSQRLRQRAATVLNAEQLRVFTQLQEELLEGFASYLRQNGGR